MDRRFLTILAVIVLIFVGILVSTNKSKNNSANNKSNASPTAHYFGTAKDNVTLQEYGDFECPVCELYYQPLKDATTQMEGSTRFQFSNLPLSTIHPNAFAAARAAEAASLQNKYWEMHDKLYQNQSDWAQSNSASNIFDGYAKDLGLNVSQFQQDYASTKVNDSINADISAFLNTSYANHDSRKQATPTFFLDGKYVPNSEFVDASTGRPSADKIVAYLKAQVSQQTKH